MSMEVFPNRTCPRREACPSVGTVLTADLPSLSDLHLNLNAQQYFWFLDIQACRVDCFAKDKGKHPATKYFTGNLFALFCVFTKMSRRITLWNDYATATLWPSPASGCGNCHNSTKKKKVADHWGSTGPSNVCRYQVPHFRADGGRRLLLSLSVFPFIWQMWKT